MSAGFKILGFGGASSSTETKLCSDFQQESFRSQTSRFHSETKLKQLHGGYLDSNDFFVVTAEDAILFKTSELYSGSSRGIVFNLLSDFLSPRRISPLTVIESGITEVEFGEIQLRLEGHIDEILSEVESNLDCCGNSTVGIPYFSGGDPLVCQCYDPDPPEPRHEKEVCFPPHNKYVFLKWQGLCIVMNGQSGSDLYSRGCRPASKAAHMMWKFESNGLLRSRYNTRLCVGIGQTGRLITQSCDPNNDKQLWGFDQEGGYLFQLSDPSKCATVDIETSNKDYHEVSFLNLGNCTSGDDVSQPLCHDGLWNGGEERYTCCASLCVDSSGNPQCGGPGCDKLPNGWGSCCMGPIHGSGRVCDDPYDIKCFVEGDGAKSKNLKGALLQQFVLKDNP